MKIITECICKLCCSGKLPGVGSHLFSEFIIKETLNKMGKADASGKGRELLFGIMADKGVGLYFRDAGEEAKKYLKKNEFTDEEVEELKKMENPLTDRFLVCYSCEKLFQPVENLFEEIYKKLIDSNKVDSEEFELSEDEQTITQLFLYTNIWRFSKSKLTRWKLNDDLEICLTEIMHQTYIVKTKGDLLEDFKEAKATRKCLDLITFFDKTENLEPQNPNSNFIFGYHSSDPYLLVVNRLLIFISANSFDIVGVPKICKGAIDSLIEYVENRKKVIYKIENDKIEKINKNCAVEQLDIFYETLKMQFVHEFEKEIRRSPIENEINQYMSKALYHIGEYYKYMESEVAISDLLAEEIELYK